MCKLIINYLDIFVIITNHINLMNRISNLGLDTISYIPMQRTTLEDKIKVFKDSMIRVAYVSPGSLLQESITGKLTACSVKTCVQPNRSYNLVTLTLDYTKPIIFIDSDEANSPDLTAYVKGIIKKITLA